MTLNKQHGGVRVSFKAEGYTRTIWLAKDDLLSERTIRYALESELKSQGIEYHFNGLEIDEIKNFKV